MPTHKATPCKCPWCDAPIDRASNSPADDGKPTPNPGDPTICFKCSGLLVFKDDLTVRKMSDEEFKACSPAQQRVIRMTQELVKQFRNIQ